MELGQVPQSFVIVYLVPELLCLLLFLQVHVRHVRLTRHFNLFIYIYYVTYFYSNYKMSVLLYRHQPINQYWFFSIIFICIQDLYYIICLKMDRYGFGSLRTEADAKVMSQTVMNAISKNDQFLKSKAEEILSEMHQQLQQKNTSPLAKTMILHVLKELTYLCHIKFFTVLMSHKLNAHLYEQALKIDPKKNINEKGLNLYPGEPKLGNQYMVLLSELLHFWGQKFGKTGKNSEPTRYKKNLTQLRQKGVVLSSNYSIIDTTQIKQKLKSSVSPPVITQLNPQGGTGGKLYNTLKYFYNKIDLYVNSLEEEQRIQVLMGNIQKNHENFNKQWNELKKRGDQAQQDDQTLTLFLGLMQFVEQQNKFYSDYIPLSDVKSYETQVKILFQKQFENIKKDDKNVPPEENRFLGNQNGGKQIKTRSNPPNPSNSQNPPNPSSSAGLDVLGLINNFYSKVEQRSKSPGFKGIEKQLQKQKQTIKKSPMRSTRSPRNRSQVGGLNKSNASSFKQGKVPAIFTSPPNLRVRDKTYEGETIFQNKQLSRIHYNIKKQQGSRRFKVSNFRQKNSLFENEQIQVGFKSQAVYEQINEFNHFIMLNLFIGNRTSEGIKECQVEYKGDNNQLLYANPKTVDSIIPAGYQSKHDLMITPIKVPFNFMVMHISYKFRESGYMVSVVLPNSVLKFASYMKISRQQFEKNWQSARKFKTNQFRLCRYLSPDNFNKWIPVLQNMTKYSQFAREGSQTDLQLFCSVIMLQQYEAVLKINVRPNLEVVLQLGVLDNNPEGLEYFKFYLQSLELIMKQIDI